MLTAAPTSASPWRSRTSCVRPLGERRLHAACPQQRPPPPVVQPTCFAATENRAGFTEQRQPSTGTAQAPHGAAGLLLGTLSAGWRVVVHKPPPPPDMARSPLQPLLVVAAREPGLVRSGAAPAVALRFTPAAGGPDADQLAGAAEVGPSSQVDVPWICWAHGCKGISGFTAGQGAVSR
jgi:hypothetical protein